MAKKKKVEETAGGGPIRALAFAAVAMVAGVLSIVVLYNLIGSYQVQIAEAKKPEDTVMVIVAARDLYQGVTITEEDLYAVEIPPRFLPENVFLSPEHVVGRIPRERILANEFIRADRLADPESGIGLNAVIPRGMRAISVDITDGRALSGFLNPGNYVDVIVTIMPDIEGGRGPQNTETKTIMQAVFVLGVNSRMGNESVEVASQKRGSRAPTVTLLVTAEGAETIAYAETQGSITLALRNDLDIAYAETTGVDVDALRRKLEKPTVVRSRAPKVEDPGGELIIIKGSTRETKRTDGQGVIK